MKQQRTYIFIGITSVALVIVLIIQWLWICKTAAIREQLFNEKANSVLSKTADAIAGDEKTCQDLATNISNADIHVIDSVLKHYMDAYNIHLSYRFAIHQNDSLQITTPFGTPGRDVNAEDWAPKKSTLFKRSLEEIVRKKGMELYLTFPDRRQYLLEEMGGIFIPSVILILIVLILSWKTILSLMNEKKLMEQSSDFLNNMTHEFRTPLTNIALAVKMIRKNTHYTPDGSVAPYVEIILDENEKLKRQVDIVLGMAALERGEIPLHKEMISLHALVGEVIHRAHLQADAHHGHITPELNATHERISGDSTHLSNAFLNLIDNALKYSGETPEITIKTSNAGKSLLVTFSDHGPGIDKKYHQDVFNKYMRVPSGNVHNVKGFGLGLAYVKKIVELHNGTISVHSEKDTGATFTITLPYV